MIFEFHPYVIDIDVEKTKEFYAQGNYISCTCDDCQNFIKAIDFLTKEEKDFFENLGVDLKKITEVFVTYGDSKSMWYLCFGRLCGTIIKGESPWKKTSENSGHWDKESCYIVSDNIAVGFYEEVVMVKENFPRPVITFEFEAKIPWVLPQKSAHGNKPKKTSKISFSEIKDKVVSFLRSIRN